MLQRENGREWSEIAENHYSESLKEKNKKALNHPRANSMVGKILTIKQETRKLLYLKGYNRKYIIFAIK